MTAIPFWDDDPRAWDTVVLFGVPFPGLVQVTGSKGRKVDVQAAKGEDGGTITDNGYDPAKGSIAVRLATREHWQAWQVAFPKLDPEKKERLPCDIQHPALLAIGVRRIYVTTIDIPALADGVCTVTMQWVQWFPTAKPTRGPARKIGGVQKDLITPLGGAMIPLNLSIPPSQRNFEP